MVVTANLPLEKNNFLSYTPRLWLGRMHSFESMLPSHVLQCSLAFTCQNPLLRDWTKWKSKLKNNMLPYFILWVSMWTYSVFPVLAFTGGNRVFLFFFFIFGSIRQRLLLQQEISVGKPKAPPSSYYSSFASIQKLLMLNTEIHLTSNNGIKLLPSVSPLLLINSAELPALYHCYCLEVLG